MEVKGAGEAAAFLLVVATMSAALVVADQKLLKSRTPKFVGPAAMAVAGVAGFAVANATGYHNLAVPVLSAGASAAATVLLDRVAGLGPSAVIAPAAMPKLPSYTIPVGEYATYSGEVPGHFEG